MRHVRNGLAVVFLSAALSALSFASAAGQDAADPQHTLRTLHSGDTLRVWAGDLGIDGRVAMFSDLRQDTLHLRRGPGRRGLPRDAAILASDLTRLQVRRGERRSIGGGFLGFALGLVGGAFAGSIIGPVLECGGRCGASESDGLGGFIMGGLFGAGLGAVIGAGVGSGPYARWERVSLTSPPSQPK